MSEPAFVHEVPFPLFQRIIFFAFGLVPTIMAPYELWRGVWPPNMFSPFFGLLIFAGMSIGLALLQASLFGASAVMEFSPDHLAILERTPWSRRQSVYDCEAIADIGIVRNTSSDGPDDWSVEILLHNGRKLGSRPFGTEERAAQEALAFRTALRCPV